MMPENLTPEEGDQLLGIARQALENGVRQQPLPLLDPAALPPRLNVPGASFVTLTIGGELRGCIGALEAYHPLAQDVQEHAVAAALEDFRFRPVQPDELTLIHIEVSHLTAPQPLAYQDAADLLARLRPGIDGVILRDGFRHATFLPQVWEKLPSPASFLSHLCQKMGAAADLWERKKLEVLIYQVQEFHEARP